ncbi:dTDP-4-dehydrorhamnose reductase [Phyllobacterium ifriqiyense]|uniref:dTDP-4-dehydrorhamnose reductase n=1 Tax=Phyllobacterium ifriqiyense TaxID=314238 RepID=A0ABU0S2B3_9HYPH|nr:dTDP-4-dehydrorhamnose reductase [Phyllobacterium ifriqiyense]MDQ0994925.1 dTDP-4-dehydrorhamnose reductase [Phyllobacterium ifriqiyense]
MKIVVTGHEGQVVLSLMERAALHPSIELVALGRPKLDLAQPQTIFQAIVDAAPDLVVSAAAYTAVDQAEDEAELASVINTAGATAVAEAAAHINAPIIHLSTDYVFSGEGREPYKEEDPTGPKGVYGQTKLNGELGVIQANKRHFILRTAWVYSPFGKNFVKTMLRLAETRDQLSVVSDQWGNPTSALDIADAILHMAERLQTDPSFNSFGVYHLAGTGSTNWSGFAQKIFEYSRARNGPYADVAGIATADYPTKAKRPLNSQLSTDRFFETFGWRAPEWPQSLEHVVDRILADNSQG